MVLDVAVDKNGRESLAVERAPDFSAIAHLKECITLGQTALLEIDRRLDISVGILPAFFEGNSSGPTAAMSHCEDSPERYAFGSPGCFGR